MSKARLKPRKKGKRAPSHKKNWGAALIQAVWPQERDFFERPDRYRYVRKLLPETGCVFCACNDVPPGPENLVLARDPWVTIVMNKYPYNTGHLLITPRIHVGNIWDLSDDVNARLAYWLKLSAQILKQELNCQGFNMGLNHGQVAGAGIPDHLHWHIVPRWGGDTNFFPLIAETKVLPQTLEETFARLKPHFEEKM